MDVAYNQHSDPARRKNRSTTNINHLSLAPLTVKLPINDSDAIPDSVVPISHGTYLQGKSAPTTPRLLSRGSVTPRSRSHHRTPSAPGGPIPTSQSSTHLGHGGHGKKSRSGASTPRRRDGPGPGNGNGNGNGGENESDWLLRAGALLSSEAREYKGQAWLVSRQSSTSLAGVRDADEEAFEQELAREREAASRRASRRGSSAAADDDATPGGSRLSSRLNSRKHSMVETRGHADAPPDRAGADADADDSYFPSHQGGIAGPDFVNLDEKLEELEHDTAQDDEATVRRLVRHGAAGQGSWISNVIGWSLFKVDENEEDSEDDEADAMEEEKEEEEPACAGRGVPSHRHFEHVLHAPIERLPPPTADQGGWKDAAWLLSVASKVMF
ncbi:uncharacterized protein UV8b_07220 [Ustilaginoidea virens]|uniref:Uncharacterized protein n=1 Tax=Ustilaginoidea virens TaxID=1159556 RepID=A0A063BUW3_USTVR|nr:uncharacterized protein UV8b_07220 [Ustilaginoidea virens]QUC22979.1 hypothetical protein UV8b_07220 [Ustilaginoidea virens]GAO18445.1 hypothetical protein UVI_02042410 [Ustilaginoidea virens]